MLIYFGSERTSELFLYFSRNQDPYIRLLRFKSSHYHFYPLFKSGHQLQPHHANSLRSRARRTKGSRHQRHFQGAISARGCQEDCQEAIRGTLRFRKEQMVLHSSQILDGSPLKSVPIATCFLSFVIFPSLFLSYSFHTHTLVIFLQAHSCHVCTFYYTQTNSPHTHNQTPQKETICSCYSFLENRI